MYQHLYICALDFDGIDRVVAKIPQPFINADTVDNAAVELHRGIPAEFIQYS